MRAVNLIPQDTPKTRRPNIPSVTLSGPIGAYAVLAVLAVAVVMAGALALSSKQLSDKQSELARVEQEARASEAKAATLHSYTTFAASRQARVDTVAGLLKGRFDWAHSLREVARVVPADVALTSLVGTVSPSSQLDGSGSAGPLRAALPVPAIDIIGCAKSQSHVATLLARLRAIDGVERVSLSSSEKSDSASLNETDCRGNEQMPQFQVTIFYKAQDGIVPAVDATAAPAAETAPTATSTGGSK
jgi:Tfp pilus assembly protein PilN